MAERQYVVLVDAGFGHPDVVYVGNHHAANAYKAALEQDNRWTVCVQAVVSVELIEQELADLAADAA